MKLFCQIFIQIASVDLSIKGHKDTGPPLGGQNFEVFRPYLHNHRLNQKAVLHDYGGIVPGHFKKNLHFSRAPFLTFGGGGEKIENFEKFSPQVWSKNLPNFSSLAHPNGKKGARLKCNFFLK